MGTPTLVYHWKVGLPILEAIFEKMANPAPTQERDYLSVQLVARASHLLHLDYPEYQESLENLETLGFLYVVACCWVSQAQMAGNLPMEP